MESLSTGAVFGLLSIIEHKPRSATVETREPSILIKFDLNHIASSLPRGKDIYNTIVINHINDLATIIRSTNMLAIQSMKTGIEDSKSASALATSSPRRSSLWPHIHFSRDLPRTMSKP